MFLQNYFPEYIFPENNSSLRNKHKLLNNNLAELK